MISAVVLGVVLGFDDGREIFEAGAWFANYLLMACLGLIALIVMVLGHKWAAARYSIQAEYRTFSIMRFGFRRYQYLHQKPPLNKIPLGVLIPLIIAIFTEGKIWFAAVGMMLTSAKPEHRIGRKWMHIPDYEEARIAFAGPIATMMFMIIAALLFENTGLEIWKEITIVNMALLISNLIPFPQLAGGRMLFNSIYLFMFAVTLAAIMSLLILFIPTVAALTSALLLAIVAVIVVYFKREV